jgi:hypothetical protein
MEGYGDLKKFLRYFSAALLVKRATKVIDPTDAARARRMLPKPGCIRWLFLGNNVL